MAPVHIDFSKVFEFEDAQQFYDWLGVNHQRGTEVWIKIHKVNSGLQSITPKEAIDAALCWGWIDAIRKSFDDQSYLQRYTPRGKKSIWSQINVDNVARLVKLGQMTEHGLRQVDLAKADGRWDHAYASGKNMVLPPDLLSAIKAEPKALKNLAKLSAQNRFAMAFRLHKLKTEAARARNIAQYVQMLKNAETIYPQSWK